MDEAAGGRAARGEPRAEELRASGGARRLGRIRGGPRPLVESLGAPRPRPLRGGSAVAARGMTRTASRTEGQAHPGVALVIIEAHRGRNALDPGELWRYRDLLYFLTRRDVSVRYRPAALGVLWALVQPVMS